MSIDNFSNNSEKDEFEEYRDQFDEEGGGSNGDKPSGSRPFLVALSIIGGLLLLAIIGLVIFSSINNRPAKTVVQEDTTSIDAQNTAISIQATDITLKQIQKMTQLAALAVPSLTPTSVIAVATKTPQPTSIVAAAGDPAERTATVAAFLTEVAQTTQTVSAGASAKTPSATSTALPNTGMMDDIGLPGLLGTAFALILIIIVVRRLRLSTPHA